MKSNHIGYDLPRGFSSGKVEIIIFPVEKDNNLSPEKKYRKTSIRGALKKYANPSLVQMEEKAWSEASQDKYANS